MLNVNPNFASMKLTPIRVILGLAVLVELAWFLSPHMGANPYRRLERQEAFLAWKRLGTPEAKAVYETECARADSHETLIDFLFIGGFMTLNCVLGFAVWKYDFRKAPG